MELDDCLMEIATDPQSELMDQTTLMSCYNWHVQSYLDRTGPYEMQVYDEKEALIRHMQTFDFAGYKADVDLAYLGNKLFVFQLDMMHQELDNPGNKVKRVQYGLKHAPQDICAKLTALGLQPDPDWLAPPEGIPYEPGEMPGKGDDDRPKSTKHRARLPIPEGCLDSDQNGWENGQSRLGPGDM